MFPLATTEFSDRPLGLDVPTRNDRNFRLADPTRLHLGSDDVSDRLAPGSLPVTNDRMLLMRRCSLNTPLNTIIALIS